MADSVRTVPISSVPDETRVTNRFGILFAKLLEVKEGEAMEIAAKGKLECHHIARMLRRIAQKESLQLEWRRNAGGSKVYVWLDRKAQNGDRLL